MADEVKFEIVRRKDALAAGMTRYFTGKPCKHGHLAPRKSMCGGCIVCAGQTTKNWLGTAAGKAKVSAAVTKRNKRLPQEYLFYGCRNRAQNKGVEFSIDRQDIVIPEHCPCCSSKMQTGTGERHYASPSVDRFDPAKGYTKENIRVICWRCNDLKKNASLSELENIVAWMHSEREKTKSATILKLAVNNG